ncbi:MAG TPA: topoisomerase C-terminal repeat-containing protein, partial [Afifellaceae bacterium]|nr:topoisomerase C-terminal repeat-containing protein [Afifellaceae bacterium]
ELRVAQVLEALNEILGESVFPPVEDGGDPRRCRACEDGRLSLKLGRFGAFIGCSNYPECRYTRQIGQPEKGGESEAAEVIVLGDDPETGLSVTLRSGRFGPYVQLGEGDKPKRASLPKDWDQGTIDLEKALRLLRLPREIAPHPETGKPITAGIGRYGPFVAHEGKYASLSSTEEVFEVGANRAVALLAERQARRGGGQSVLRELGEHPEAGGLVTVRAGRYGPYVNHGKVNATLPKGVEPEGVTLAEAVELLAARAAKGGTARGAGRKAARTAKAGAAKGGAAKGGSKPAKSTARGKAKATAK